MTINFLKRQAEELQKLARSTTERAERNPADFWTAVVAENQRQAALDVSQQLEKLEADTAKKRHRE
jgi:hypothetical protein